MAKLRLLLSEAYLTGLTVCVNALLIVAPHPKVADWLVRSGLLRKLGIEADEHGEFQVIGPPPPGWEKRNKGEA